MSFWHLTIIYLLKWYFNIDRWLKLFLQLGFCIRTYNCNIYFLMLVVLWVAWLFVCLGVFLVKKFSCCFWWVCVVFCVSFLLALFLFFKGFEHYCWHKFINSAPPPPTHTHTLNRKTNDWFYLKMYKQNYETKRTTKTIRENPMQPSYKWKYFI